MTEENEFEWNPNEGDIDMSKELISIHNSKFKNNEPLEQYKYQDYMLKNVELHEIDVTGLFFNDDFTNRMASLSDDSSVESSVPNIDNDTCKIVQLTLKLYKQIQLRLGTPQMHITALVVIQ